MEKCKSGQQPPSHINNPKENTLILNRSGLIKSSKQSLLQTYELGKKIGQGSFGEVFIVKHKKLGVIRAMKVIAKGQNHNHNTYDELQVLKKLDHPNILKIYEYFEQPQKWYIVTEYFQGRELFDEIIQSKSINEQKTAIIFHEILKALAYIHNNKIAHRDIKAQNILIRKQKNSIGYIVKIIDWGLGCLVGTQDLIRKCGTPEYCAPQVLQGRYTLSCDMWSLGVLLFIMLSGTMPFRGDSVSQTLQMVRKAKLTFKAAIWNQISFPAKKLVLKLIEKDPKKRLSAVQCLRNKWLLHYTTKQNQASKFLQQTLIRLQKFNATNKFQLVVLNFIMNYIETPKQNQQLKKQFELLDTNKDGVLSYQELLTAYQKLYGIQAQKIVEKIFIQLDLDGSGSIEYSEFITFAGQINTKLNLQQLKQAFKLFDIDGDGLIDCQEINRILRYEQTNTYHKQLNNIIQHIDLNSDGKIDLQQFINHIKSAIEIITSQSCNNVINQE